MRRKKHSATLNQNMKVPREPDYLSKLPFFCFWEHDLSEEPNEDSSDKLEDTFKTWNPAKISPSTGLFLLLEQLIELLLALKYGLTEDIIFPRQNKEPVFLDLEKPGPLGSSEVVFKGPKPVVYSLRCWLPFVEELLQSFIRLRGDIGSNRVPDTPPTLNRTIPHYNHQIEVFKEVIRELEEELSEQREESKLRDRYVAQQNYYESLLDKKNHIHTTSTKLYLHEINDLLHYASPEQFFKMQKRLKSANSKGPNKHESGQNGKKHRRFVHERQKSKFHSRSNRNASKVIIIK